MSGILNRQSMGVLMLASRLILEVAPGMQSADRCSRFLPRTSIERKRWMIFIVPSDRAISNSPLLLSFGLAIKTLARTRLPEEIP